MAPTIARSICATIYGTDRLTDEQWREIAATYHGMVSRLDWHVGRLVAALGDEPDTMSSSSAITASTSATTT
ncbi:MAG: hypothetical protein R2710_09005 [Acidimicrobiales bacterium]